MNRFWIWVAIAVVGIGAAWTGVSWQVLLPVGFLLLCVIPMVMMSMGTRRHTRDHEILRDGDRANTKSTSEDVERQTKQKGS